MDHHNPQETGQQLIQEGETYSAINNLITVDGVNSLNSVERPQPFSLASVPSCLVIDDNAYRHNFSIPIITSNITPSNITNSRIPLISSEAFSLNSNAQPQTLFLQALSKLNQSSINIAVNGVNSTLENGVLSIANNALPNIPMDQVVAKSPELSPPVSLMNAPPSYSSVLRQLAFRRRPRIVGTFIPSPSFVQQTPPPNYGAAFDVYLDNLPSPPTRIYNFGFTPTPVLCPDCGYTGLTIVNAKITVCTHLCAVILCLLCCWICVPLPYVLRSCKDVYHYCRNCRRFLGMYCPTNPDSAVP